MSNPGRRLPLDGLTKLQKYHREWYENNRERIRKYQKSKGHGSLRFKLGVTPEIYQKQLSLQDGLCAICKKLPKEGGCLQLDHNHTTKFARGLLCSSCNNNLRGVENLEWLDKAINYILFWEEIEERASEQVD